jgi:hypothetical protein
MRRVFHGHDIASCALVVIEQINIRSVALLEPENDPPVGADGDTSITCEVAFQRVQPPARQVEMARLCRLIEPGSMRVILSARSGIYLATVVVFIQASEAPMAKPPDHSAMI